MIEKKKGVMSLQAVIGLLLAVILVAVLADMLTLTNRYMSLHDTVKELSRTMAVQGGCMATKPDGYPNNYYDAVTLSKLVDKSMKIGGFKGNDYKVTVTYTKFDTNATTGKIENDGTYSKDFLVCTDGTQYVYPTDKIDYLNDFNVTISAEYNWIFSRFAIGQKPIIIKSSAPGVSEWKYDYDIWDSES